MGWDGMGCHIVQADGMGCCEMRCDATKYNNMGYNAIQQGATYGMQCDEVPQGQ